MLQVLNFFLRFRAFCGSLTRRVTHICREKYFAAALVSAHISAGHENNAICVRRNYS